MYSIKEIIASVNKINNTSENLLSLKKLREEKLQFGISKVFQYCKYDEKTESNLLKGRIHYSNPSFFNDPFDSYIILPTNQLKAVELTTLISERLKGLYIYSKPFIFKIQYSLLNNIIDEELLNNYFPYVKSNCILNSRVAWMLDGLKLLFKNTNASILLDLINEKSVWKKFSLFFKLYNNDTNNHYIVTFKSILQQMNQNKIEYIKRFNESLNKSIRISSFTTKSNNILMWSHYGDRHKGVCIEYDISKCEELNFLKGLYNVIYSKHRMNLPIEDISFLENFEYKIKDDLKSTEDIFIAFLHKYNKWEYEHEIRSIVNNTDLDLNDCLSTNMISRIYLGANMSNENKEKIKQIAKAKGYDIREYLLDDTNYSIKLKAISKNNI